MSGVRIAFLHVGPDATLATILTRSLRAVHEDAHITQCTDRLTPPVAGVDSVFRVDGDTSRLMTFRLSVFAQFAQTGPTFFLDTDMICLRALDAEAALDGKQVAICRRQYQTRTLINPRAMNMDLPEYAGKTLGEVYPYLACAVVTRTPAFWAACQQALTNLPEKFQVWFGDQEAMKVIVEGGAFTAAWLAESAYACLPDLETNPAADPKLLHFKGPARKGMMLEVARQRRLLGE